MSDKTFIEEIEVNASQLMEKLKEIVHEGNVRHIKIKDKEGKEVLDMPLTIGAVGVVIAPYLAAILALIGVASDYTLTVVREQPEAPPAPDAQNPTP